MKQNNNADALNITEEFESFEDVEVENIISAGAGTMGCCD